MSLKRICVAINCISDVTVGTCEKGTTCYIEKSLKGNGTAHSFFIDGVFVDHEFSVKTLISKFLPYFSK